MVQSVTPDPLLKLDDWQGNARKILRAHLERNGIGYGDLATALQSIKVPATRKTVTDRINDGAFSFAFFLQCMYVLKVDVVRLWDRGLPDTPPIGLWPPQPVRRVRGKD